MKFSTFITCCKKTKAFNECFLKYQLTLEKYDDLTDEEKRELLFTRIFFTSFGFSDSLLDIMHIGNSNVLINAWLKDNFGYNKFKLNYCYSITRELLIELSNCIDMVLTDNTKLNEIFPNDSDVKLDLLDSDIIKEFQCIEQLINSLININDDEIEYIYLMSI